MTEAIEKRGHRWFAAMYDGQNRRWEKRVFSKLRSRIAGEAAGRVLEIGAGTGANLPYYPPNAQVVATDPDPFMLERAAKRVESLALSNVELRQAPAEALPFDDDTFDHVVCSIVLCSVQDQARALAEVKRVLRQGGTSRFFEHVRSDGRLVGSVQDVITPVWRWFGAGCHPNRRTQQAIEDQGFRIEQLEEIRILRVWPIIAGIALRAEPVP